MSEIKLIRVPKWGLSMEEGTVAVWRIAEGDTFEEGQDICEIETSKIANVLEAPFSGRLHKIIAHPGTTLPVQAVIAVSAPSGTSDEAVKATLALEGEGIALAAADPESVSQASPAREQDVSGTPSHSVSNTSERERPINQKAVGAWQVPDHLVGPASADIFASPRALSVAEKERIDLSKVDGTGRLSRIEVRDIRRVVQAAGGRAPARSLHPNAEGVFTNTALVHSEVMATPVARRLAETWGIPLHVCRPTGRGGRVCKADVEAIRAISSSQLAQPSHSAVSNDAKESGFDVIPMTPMRKTIAARLSQSKQMAPHFRVAVEVYVDALMALRKELNRDHPQVNVTVNDFVVKAVAAALVEHEDINIQFDGEEIRRFPHADVAVAVAVKAGLITPIVRTADKKTLVEISSEIRHLATKAKAGNLRAEEFQGGTFTVSNLGMFGVSQFDAIINPPQAAILAVSAARQGVKFDGDKPFPCSVMTLNLASDHRVIDGATAASFLQTIRRNLESPIVMLAGNAR